MHPFWGIFALTACFVGCLNSEKHLLFLGTAERQPQISGHSVKVLIMQTLNPKP